MKTELVTYINLPFIMDPAKILKRKHVSLMLDGVHTQTRLVIDVEEFVPVVLQGDVFLD